MGPEKRLIFEIKVFVLTKIVFQVPSSDRFFGFKVERFTDGDLIEGKFPRS